jgi:transcriptional regulator with XRE-family HTH domain
LKESDVNLRAFGKKIRDRREEERWTQEDLAGKVGISRPYMSQIERGVAKNLTLRLVQDLMTALDLRPSEVFEERPRWLALPPGLNEFAKEVDLPAEDVEMLANIQYRGKQPTTPEGWQALFATIKALAEVSPVGSAENASSP